MRTIFDQSFRSFQFGRNSSENERFRCGQYNFRKNLGKKILNKDFERSDLDETQRVEIRAKMNVYMYLGFVLDR